MSSNFPHLSEKFFSDKQFRAYASASVLPLSYDNQLFPRTGDCGIQPFPAVLEKGRFVYHNDEIVFRSLRLMTGNGVSKFETVDRFLPLDAKPAENFAVVLVHERIILQKARLIPVPVEEAPLRKNSCVDRQIVRFVREKIGLKVQLRKSVLRLPHVVAFADNAV